jgi:hypothetical protein
MLRRAMLLSVALAGILGCTDAWAAPTTLTVPGDVLAMAFAGDSPIVARQQPDGSFRLERLTPGAGTQTLVRLPRPDGDPYVSLAASTRALALGVAADGDDDGSHAFVGPPGGPLREVATCAVGLIQPLVAVDAARAAWTEGLCGDGHGVPQAVSPLTIVVGSANPATPTRRVPVGSEMLPTGMVLAGGTELVGLLRSSFFSYANSEVRRIGSSQLGATIVAQNGAIIAPVGALPNRDAVFVLSPVDASEEGESETTVCGTSLFVLTPGGTQRRTLSLGGCMDQDDLRQAGGGAHVTGDRVYALVARSEATGEAPAPRALTSVRGDGGDLRVHATGTYRFPQGFAVRDDGRVAWWQLGCTGDTEIVIDDGATPVNAFKIPPCRVQVPNRRARVRGGRATIGMKCPHGCAGAARAGTRLRSRFLRAFSFAAGTHRLRVRVNRRERRAKRLKLRLVVNEGPTRAVVIRLR